MFKIPEIALFHQIKILSKKLIGHSLQEGEPTNDASILIKRKTRQVQEAPQVIKISTSYDILWVHMI